MFRMDRGEYITPFAPFVDLSNQAFGLCGQYRLCQLLPLRVDHNLQRSPPPSTASSDPATFLKTELPLSSTDLCSCGTKQTSLVVSNTLPSYEPQPANAPFLAACKYTSSRLSSPYYLSSSNLAREHKLHDISPRARLFQNSLGTATSVSAKPHLFLLVTQARLQTQYFAYTSRKAIRTSFTMTISLC